MGIEVIYSSAYNPSSNALVERSVRTLKDLFKKVGPLTQLQLREMIFCSNSREHCRALRRALRAYRVAQLRGLQLGLEPLDRDQG